MLPLIMRRLGFDPPALAPFVATLVDVTGLVIYFTVASVILRHSADPGLRSVLPCVGAVSHGTLL